jgi:hypothetical protein
MRHFRSSLTVVGLVLSVVVLARLPVALADDEPNPPPPTPIIRDAASTSAQVGGIVYHIRQAEGAAVVTVLDQDIGQAVDLFIKDPNLVALVTNGTVCTNRFVQAGGVRTGVNSLTAQSLQVSLDRPCGKPPS